MEGISRLASTLQSRMQGISDKPPALELGTIGADGSLNTDGFPLPIPRNDYLVCASCALESGSRVLVAWVGNDAVVMDGIG